MDEKIMMVPERPQDSPPFDATHWFTNGMYKRRSATPLGPGDTAFNHWGMDRVRPPDFPDEQVMELRTWIMTGLEIGNPLFSMPQLPPGSEETILYNKNFDPRSQIIYNLSGFEEKDKPVDTYTFYTLLDGKRFFVQLDRDALTGKIIGARREPNISTMTSKEQDVLFGKLEKRQQPGLRVRSGTACPYPGVWECDDCELGPQTFSHGVVLPKVQGREVVWRLVKAL